MKNLLIVVSILFFTFFGNVRCLANDDRLLLFSYVDSSDRTNRWYFPLSLRDKIPKWNPESEEMPLPPRKAMQVARKWLETHNRGTNFWVESFSVCSVHRDNPELNKIFYYKLFYTLGNEQTHTVVVVLMNGEVLKPEIQKLAW